MIDHVAIQVADLDASVAFYAAVFSPIGIEELMRFGTTVGLGRDGFPHLWFSPAGGTETRELHLALAARSRDEVDAVHAAGLAAGAEVLHAPRLFPEYHAGYYGVFVRDLDGHNVEAVFHDWPPPPHRPDGLSRDIRAVPATAMPRHPCVAPCLAGGVETLGLPRRRRRAWRYGWVVPFSSPVAGGGTKAPRVDRREKVNRIAGQSLFREESRRVGDRRAGPEQRAVCERVRG